MPTIDSLQQILRHQADDAARSAPRIAATMTPDRSVRRGPRLPATATALIAAAVVLGVSATIADHATRRGAAQPAMSTAAARPREAPLVLSERSGMALTRETMTLRAPISNVTTHDLRIAYPIQLFGPGGVRVQVIAGVVTAPQGPDRSGIGSDEPVPAALSRMPRGETEDLWLRIKLDCSPSARDEQRWPDRYPTIRIAFHGGEPPAEIPLNDAQLSAVSPRLTTQPFSQLLAHACNI